MALRKYYRRKILASFSFFLIMLVLTFFAKNKNQIFTYFTKLGNIPQKNNELNHDLPPEILQSYPNSVLPFTQTAGSFLIKPNYAVFYDESVHEAIYTIHKLTKEDARGDASRYQVRFNEMEDLNIETAVWGDYSGTGYDRGHLVPAGDFRCCQNLMNETFAMSNVAPFDSVLNRNAWQELEGAIRKAAQQMGEIYVITGPVLANKLDFIGRSNLIKVPTHFYKVVAFVPEGKVFPEKVNAFLLPNIPVLHFDKNRTNISIDKLEELSGIDFFNKMEDNLEIVLEKEKNSSML